MSEKKPEAADGNATPQHILKETRKSVERVRSHLEVLRTQLRDGRKVFLQREDGRFLVAVQEWTENPEKALVFGSTLAAITFCQTFGLVGVHLLIESIDGTLEKLPLDSLLAWQAPPRESNLLPSRSADPTSRQTV